MAAPEAHRDDPPPAMDTDQQRLAAVGALAGSVAHELNNFLAVVIGNAGLLQMDTDPGSQLAQLLDQIERAGQQAAELVQETAAFAGDDVPDPVPTDLSRQIAGMQALLGAIGGAAVTIHTELDDQVPTVPGHPKQLGLVALALVWNAVSALEGRPGVVTVTTSTIAGPPTQVVLEVSGSGSGPDGPSHRRPPVRTGSAASGPPAAVAAAHRIVGAHGGTLTVEPGEHGSTTARAVLPVSPDDEAGAGPGEARH